MAISAINVRNFVARGNLDDIEGAPCHLIDKGSFLGSDRIWFRKAMESERIARLEVLAQEFFRLLIPNQPETQLGCDESSQQFYVLSEAVTKFQPLPKNQKPKFTNGTYKGLGRILIIAIFLQEVDLRNTNLGLNNHKEVIKIDGDWCFAALRDPSVWKDLPRDITPGLLEGLPYPMGIDTHHWIGLVKNRLAQVDSDYVNPTELTRAPCFRVEINQAILQLLLIPDDYLCTFISTFIGDEANSYLEFMQSRSQQLRESALRNDSFREYLVSEQALVDAQAHLLRLKTFKVNGNIPIVPPYGHSDMDNNIRRQLRELRNNVGCNPQITAVPTPATRNRDPKQGFRWLPERISFGFLSGFLGTSLITTSLILLQVIDIVNLGLSAALTATATAGIILIPALLMGGIGYLIESSCFKSVRNPTVIKRADRDIPDPLNNFEQEIRDFEAALAGLRRGKSENYIYKPTPPTISDELTERPEDRTFTCREVTQ